MKHFTIKFKVVFWYMFSIATLITLVFLVLIQAGAQMAADDAKTSLMISTDMAVNNVTVSNGQLIIDDDLIYYMDKTWIILVKDNGILISGLEPEGFPAEIPFEADRLRKIGERQRAFYIYDRLIENQNIGKVWIRGMTPASLSVRDPALFRMIKLFFIVLPVLGILSLAGGWFITIRAFFPLKQINRTVTNIQEKGDLSERIGLDGKNAKDEILMTAAAFDRMLDRISESFEREKQFTNDASHELRTPVAVIQAQSEYALENIRNERETKEALQVIHGQSLKMSSLIGQLLMLARADRDAVVLDRKKTDISLLAEEAAMAYRKEAEKKQMTINVMAEEGIYSEVDEALMGRVLENLISNAVKYGKKRGRVEVTVKKNKEAVMIAVWDDGIGISEKNLDNIWNRFFRVDSTGETEGIGLGLSLAKGIVEAHGGTISVKSRLGEYTEFLVAL